MVLGQHTYQILSRRLGGLGGLGMQGGKAWVRRAYSGAPNGLMNGVVSVLWKSAIGPFSILVFLYIMFVVTSRVVDRAMSVGLRALLRSPCRDHPHAPSIYLVCDRCFLSVAESDVKNCRTSSYLAGRGALGSIARIVSSSIL